MNDYRFKKLTIQTAIFSQLIALGCLTCHAQTLEPVSIALSKSGTFMLVANKHEGSLAIVDLTQEQPDIDDKLAIGTKPVFVRRISDDDQFLVVDFESHQLNLVQLKEETRKLEKIDRVETCRYPHRFAMNSNGQQCVVAGLWSRRLSLVSIDGSTLVKLGDLDLPFAPGPLRWLNDSSLVVADAFSDRISLISVSEDQLELEKVWRRKGHRVGGLVVHNDNLVVSDIRLNELARSVKSDIHWGTMLSNEMHGITLESLENKSERLKRAFMPRPFGGPDDGKGDPTAIINTRSGLLLTLLQGVNQLAIGDEQSDGFSYLNVGTKPTDIVVDEESNVAYVCNSLDDSIATIDLESESVTKTIKLAADKERVDRTGERLFFDASLSLESWMSCHSCHVDGHTSSLLNDNLSDGSFGAPKRILSLLGHGENLPLAWNGSIPSLETQIKKSVKTTMRGANLKADEVESLVEYVKSLPAPPSLAEARGLLDTSLIEKGEKIFEKANCGQCHTPPTFTNDETVSVGSSDAMKNQHFNPPSLIGVSQRDRFFHDGRAGSLHEVLVEFSHPQIDEKIELKENEIELLIEYLKSL